MLKRQGRNEVYRIRDQRPKKRWDPGSQPRDLESQSPGSGSAVFFIGSRIRRSVEQKEFTTRTLTLGFEILWSISFSNSWYLD